VWLGAARVTIAAVVVAPVRPDVGRLASRLPARLSRRFGSGEFVTDRAMLGHRLLQRRVDERTA
jgi:hypothetical protein